MKTNRLPIFAAAITAALAYPAIALEGPEDDAPPPPAENVSGANLPEIKLPDANQAPVAFLGIVSSDVPDMLATHLGLKGGEGIVVRSLVPDGPAAKSGVQLHDVITQVGGQPVGSPADISKQISAHKPGEKLALELIHQGKSTTLEVTLGTKPAEIAAAEPHTLDQLDLEGLPKELADRLRGALENQIGGLPDIEELRKRMQGAVAGGILGQAGAGDPAAKAQIQSNATVRMQDQHGSVEVQAKNESKEVTVRDKDGTVTWKGPWDTAQDKAAAPDAVRQRVDALNLDSTFSGKGLRLQMRQAAPDH